MFESGAVVCTRGVLHQIEAPKMLGSTCHFYSSHPADSGPLYSFEPASIGSTLGVLKILGLRGNTQIRSTVVKTIAVDVVDPQTLAI
jgi:hypothetical protein